MNLYINSIIGIWTFRNEYKVTVFNIFSTRKILFLITFRKMYKEFTNLIIEWLQCVLNQAHALTCILPRTIQKNSTLSRLAQRKNNIDDWSMLILAARCASVSVIVRALQYTVHYQWSTKLRLVVFGELLASFRRSVSRTPTSTDAHQCRCSWQKSI